jgi:hypothetical protein
VLESPRFDSDRRLPSIRMCQRGRVGAAWIRDRILLQPLMHKASMSRRATGLAMMSRDFSAVRAGQDNRGWVPAGRKVSQRRARPFCGVQRPRWPGKGSRLQVACLRTKVSRTSAVRVEASLDSRSRWWWWRGTSLRYSARLSALDRKNTVFRPVNRRDCETQAFVGSTVGESLTLAPASDGSCAEL